GLRVPLIFSGGPIKRRGTCATPVVAMDLMPTLLALAGVEPPATLDGEDLAPLLAGRDLPPRDLYFHYPHREMSSAVRRGEWKLIHKWQTGADELYALDEDPGEAHDLAREQPERVMELRAALQGWLTAVNADEPRRVSEEK